MDIWEANSRAQAIAPHPCGKPGLYECTGDECAFDGVCDKNGCGWNPNRVNVTNYYGNNNTFKVDTSRLFTVVTQFPASSTGKKTLPKLDKIHRLYVQDGKVIESYVVDAPGLPKTDSIIDEFCKATGSARFMDLGALQAMGDALSRGMVLAMSIWWDEGGNMNWLDAAEAGPCSLTEGNPKNITLVEKNPEVTFSKLRWGEIGSTYGAGSKCTRRTE